MSKLKSRWLLPVFAFVATAPFALAEGEPGISDVITGASNTLTAVMGVCIASAVFFIGLSIAKRARR